MPTVNVNIPGKEYKIFIHDSFEFLAKEALDFCKGTKVMIVTDSNVDKLFADECMQQIKKSGADAFKFVFSNGEKNKNLETVKDIYKTCLQNNFERNDTIIALGGGVAGDIAGFAAATFLRGINFVQVPTSVIAQCDSSIGGKTGVDFDGVKNIVGAFYQPKAVYINTETLKTLPEREYISGFAEIVKHAIIKDAELFELIESNIEGIKKRDIEILSSIVEKNCTIKAEIVSEDEKESGLRAILNFGHTIGHGIESAAEFSLLHGESISIGMIAACKIALELDLFERNEYERIKNLLENLGLPVSCNRIDAGNVSVLMMHDKKTSGGDIKFILPLCIGQVRISGEIPGIITKKAIEKVCNS